MIYKKLPYFVKERINLFVLNKFSDYEPLQEFNKICDYVPCKHSDIKMQRAYFNYRKQQSIHLRKRKEGSDEFFSKYSRTMMNECSFLDILFTNLIFINSSIDELLRTYSVIVAHNICTTVQWIYIEETLENDGILKSIGGTYFNS